MYPVRTDGIETARSGLPAPANASVNRPPSVATRNCCIAADPMISAAAMSCVPSGVTTGAYPRRGSGR
jgi:hypothetical protein